MKTLAMLTLLIYYGWPSCFNSTTNYWNNDLVAQDMSRYEMIVLGNGLEFSSHGDHVNTVYIISQIRILNPNTKIFGYVTTNQNLSTFQTEVQAWDTIGVDGIFLDEAGYDFGTVSTNGRVAFNEKVNYVHSMDNSKICFANAWNMDHVLGIVNDISYPNTTWNPNLVATNLTINDWYLLENFGVMNSAPESLTEYKARGSKIVNYETKINFASVSIINNSSSNAQALFTFSYYASFLYDIDAHGSSDIYYGASSASATYWTRPNLAGLGPLVTVSSPYASRKFNSTTVKLNFSKATVTR